MKEPCLHGRHGTELRSSEDTLLFGAKITRELVLHEIHGYFPP